MDGKEKSMLKINEQSNAETENIHQYGKGSPLCRNDNARLRFTRMKNLLRGVKMTNTSETKSEIQSERIQHIWLRQLVKTLLIILLGASMTACADTKSWHEEVKLLDGRVIIVHQQRRYEGAYNGSNYGGVSRESWITLKLSETGNQEITWHEKLDPSNLNIVNGKIYIVAQPPTTREYFLYNQPRPPYIGYVYDNQTWRRIPFNEIPVVMYDTNLSIDSENFIHAGQITLADKVKEFNNPRMEKYLKRIDPDVKIPGFPKNTVKVY